jgi:hypothetical protein
VYEDFASTIERIRLLLVNPDIMTTAELEDFGFVRDDVRLCIAVFIRHAVRHGTYRLWSLGVNPDPDHPRRSLEPKEMDKYIYGGRLAAKRPVPSRGADYWQHKRRVDWPRALIEGEEELSHSVVASTIGYGHRVRPALGLRNTSQSVENTSFAHPGYDGTYDSHFEKEQMNRENQPPRHTSSTSSRTITPLYGDISVLQRYGGLGLHAEAKEFFPGAGMHRL